MKFRKVVLLVFCVGVAATASSQTFSLETCVEHALANNLELKKSEYSVHQSKLSQKQSWSSLMPSVAASGSMSNSGPFVSNAADEWDWSVGGSVSQQIYQPGLYTNISLANARTQTSELSDAALENQIRSSVEKLYYQILTSDTLVSVYKANIQLSNEQIEKMRRMVDLGLKRESDLLKSEVQRGTFEAQLIREQENLASSRRGLNILMGRKPSEPLHIIPVPVEQIQVPDFVDGYQMMLDSNPSLQRLSKLVDIEKLSLRVSREAFLPSASASYSYSQRKDLLGGDPVESDNVSLRMSIDLFDGFNKSLNVQKSKVAVDNAKIDFEAAIRDYSQSLLDQYNALSTQNKLIDIHQTNLISARKDLEVVSEQYAAGLSTILDLMDAQVSVLQSEINLLSDLYARKRIESEIFRLIGSR